MYQKSTNHEDHEAHDGHSGVFPKMCFVFFVCFVVEALGSTQSPPRDWIDPATGHRIVRLTDDAGGSTLYFHDNAFSPEGDRLMFNTPRGIAMVDVARIGSPGLEAGS